MIGSLRGKVIGIDESYVLIECGGIGFEVEMPSGAARTLKLDAEVFVYTHHSVREDSEGLYGFLDKGSRELFRLLIKVSGVGPKMALSVLSTFDPAGFIQAVSDNRMKELQQIPGVGKRMAERLVVELKDRLKKLTPAQGFEAAGGTAAPSSGHVFDSAVSAMISLGYHENDSIKAVKAVYQDGMTLEGVIRAALQLFAQSRK